ncbi:MAG TPA: hypothetical protein DE061_02595 [Clostridiales bacterium]|nr:hypothetical protein [Clostridiales bacterium]HCH92559.1 hypothetical protein [Clostridiales bacterium]
MSKGIKGITVAIVFTLLLTIAIGLSACDEPEYYSVKITSNLTDNSTIQIDVSAPKDAKGYQKGENAYIGISVAPGSKYIVESVTANTEAGSTSLTLDSNTNKYNFIVESNTTISIVFAQSKDVALNVSADSEKGTYEINPDGILFAPDTAVTITATAKEGYVLKNYVVNDIETEPSSDGSLSLTLKVDTTVKINFVAHMEDAVFSTMQGRLKVNGHYVYDADDDKYDFVHNLETVFGDNQISQVESDSETGKVYFESVFGKDNRNITVIQHTANNTIAEYTSDNLFEEYYNPFDLLSASDFEKVTVTEYVLYDAAKAKNAASALSGWTESISSFKVIVENGAAVKLHIVTERIQPSAASETYVSTYDFNLSEHGTASVDTLYTQPYPHTADHDVLLAALTTASEKTAYTVRHQGHEVGYVEPEGGETRPGYGDTDYKVYVNEQMIYDSYTGEKHGYVTLNNYVYPFDYLESANQVVLRDPVNVESIKYYQPNFLGFNVALFKKVDKNKYTLHQDSMAQLIAPFFAIGNEQSYYAYATDLTLILKDGALDQVVFTYKTYGIEETVTLTFDFVTAFDAKEDLGLDFDNASKTSVLDDFIGQYKDNVGNFLTVDKSGFTYNGKEITISQYISATETEPAYFIGRWNGKVVSIMKFSSKQILITSDDYSVNVTLDSVDTGVVTIDNKFIGVWEIDDEKENLHYKVRVQTHSVWVNDVECEIISYAENEGVTIKLGNDTLYLLDAAEDKDGKFVSAMIKYANNEYVSFTLIHVDESVGIEIPEEYVGMYMSDDEKYKVVITYSSITINGIEYIPTSYSEATGFVGTYGTDTEYRIAFYSVAGSLNKDVLQIGNGDKLNRVESLNKNYIGTWESDPEITEYHYTVVFTETALNINGKSYPVRYNQTYGYEVEFEGDGYTTYILFFYNTYGNPSMIMYSNSGMTINLYKKVPTKVPEEIIGTWEGNNGATAITTIIDKNGNLQIKIGNGDFKSINAEYDTEKGQFAFALDGTNTFLIYDTDAKTFNLYQIDGYDVDLAKSATIDIPDNFFGTWVSSDGKTKVIVEKGKLSVMINGGELVKVAEATSDEFGVYFTANGIEYSLSASYGEDNQILIADEDYAFHVLLTLQA